jgi:hypothetical protein
MHQTSTVGAQQNRDGCVPQSTRLCFVLVLYICLHAADYARIVKDLATIGDTVDISTTKDAVKFSTSGDIGTANVTVRCGRCAHMVLRG